MSKRNTYWVSVYYQYDVTVKVSAKTERQAIALACKRVSKRSIGRKAIDRTCTDVVHSEINY